MCDKFTKRGHTVFACEIAAKSHRAANYLASNTKIKSRQKKLLYIQWLGTENKKEKSTVVSRHSNLDDYETMRE